MLFVFVVMFVFFFLVFLIVFLLNKNYFICEIYFCFIYYVENKNLVSDFNRNYY